MTLLLYKNNAGTTLQSNITAAASTAVLAAGTGALFPLPVPGTSAFFMTFRDAATEIVNEIVLVTARTGDAITMLRAQQGSAARAWSAGDLADQLVTMGDMDGMVQPDQLQQNVYSGCEGGGTANSITATLPSGLTTIPDMMPLIVMATAPNTGGVTLTLTLGTTVQSAEPIQKFGGSSLNAGDIPVAGFPIQLVWSATLAAFIMTNPASGSAGSIAGGALNQMLRQTAPGTTGFVAAPTIAGQVLAFVGGVIAWAAAAVTTFNGRAGAVVPQTGDYTPAQVGSVPATSFQGGNVQLANPGYVALPNTGPGNGYTIQGGSRAITGAAQFIAFPKSFPNGCASVVASCNNQSSAIRVDSVTAAGFVVQTAASNINWIAVGW